jgi:large subunit ribosomal protein L28
MACELTGKGRFKANIVSHSNIKTRRFRLPNLVKKKWFIPEANTSLTLRLSSHGLKTIDHRGGIVAAILMEKEDNLSERLLKIKRQIVKARKPSSTKPRSSKGETSEVQN